MTTSVPFGSLLSKIIDNRGKTCPTSEAGIPLIATNCIKNEHLYPVYEKVRYVSQEVYDSWFRGHPEPGDLIFVLKGTPGRVNWVNNPVDFCIAQDMVALRVDENKVYPKYLFAVLRSSQIQQEIEGLHVGSLIPHFKKSDFDDLQIPLVEEKLQKYIGDVYFNLSLKIDLLHRQNKTLEAMAETLFRQWFIEDESLDEVAVSELVTFNPKRTLAKGTESTYLEMAGLSTQNFNATGYYKREFTSGTKFIHQDTLLARITPCLENGKAGYVTFLSDREVGWGSTEYIVMRPKSGIHPLMAYVLCRNQDFKDYAESCMEGSSGRQRVNVEHLQEFTIGKPTDEVIQQFNEYLESIESKLIYNSKQIQTLENLRGTLLPKLMSGEVRVQLQTEEVA
ncbi:restriction endonuclease subunit S [Acinetobacter soli]|uniref:restriction endonuclease subunit S n=1 Tax=Acinetobacter soli TaxID=487316 RepID=UPI002FEF2DF4